MPPVVAAALVTGAAGIGTTALASHAAGSAARRSSNTQAQSDAATLQFAKEQAAAQRADEERVNAQAQARWEAEQTQAKAIFDEDQRRYADEQSRYNDELSRRQPYQQASYGALTRLGDLVGVSIPPYQQPRTYRDPYELTPIGSIGQPSRQPVSTTMPVANPNQGYASGQFSAMIPRVNPVNPQQFVSMRTLAGY